MSMSDHVALVGITYDPKRLRFEAGDTVGAGRLPAAVVKELVAQGALAPTAGEEPPAAEEGGR